jgi:hypothetical protein
MLSPVLPEGWYNRKGQIANRFCTTFETEECERLREVLIWRFRSAPATACSPFGSIRNSAERLHLADCDPGLGFLPRVSSQNNEAFLAALW